MRYSFTNRCVAFLSWASLLLPSIMVIPFSALAHHVKVHDLAAVQLTVTDGGQLVADYGSFQVYEVDTLRTELLQNERVEVRDDFDHIHLNTGMIDTSTAAVKTARKTVGAFTGKHLHLIQFVGPIKPDWHADLQKTGVTLIDYIPENTYLVYGDAAAIGKLQELTTTHKSIQWDGVYDIYKIHPNAQLRDEKGLSRQIGTDEFTIQLVDDPLANKATLAVIDELKLAPIHRQYKRLHYLNLVAHLSKITFEKQSKKASVSGDNG